ncbi:MAG: cell surface protein [Bacteroidetes bacterium]|nr:cell surface protein [Bacteroidota bacterium]
MRRRILTFLLFLSFSISAIASHIVGGEMIYDYQGGNTYQITLKLYRNCLASCTQCAPYDTVLYVHIFDANGNYQQSVGLSLPPTQVLPNTVTNPCMDPVDVCVEQAYYTGTVTLPPLAGGYTLVYERCCRNSDITTIPQNTGAAYVAHIPGIANASNSSPRFSNQPPTFICNSQYLQFDYSAVDPDGDSLAYSMVNALDYAGSSGNFAPQPGSAVPPPFNSVPYLSPYGSGNPTNNPSNADNLSIDPTTGLLTGIPNQSGSFIVSVAVSEYRNGVYVGQTIRDYQFNVVACNIPKANLIYQPGTYDPIHDIGVYTFQCSSDTVNFNNVSFYNPPPTNTQLSYHWDFGLTNRTDDTSNLQYPIFYYPDTGTYTVTISVAKFKPGIGWCYDTARGYVIVFPKLHAAYNYINACRDSAITFIDSSYSTTSPLNAWHWDFGDGDTTNVRNPKYTFPANNTYHVVLTAHNQKGCIDTFSYNITPRPLPFPDFIAPPACLTDSTHFTYTGSGAVTNYYWDFGNGQTSTLQDPVVLYTTTGPQTVSLITVTAQGCRDTITKSITIYPLPVVTHPAPVKICPNSTTQLNETGGVNYVWTPASSLSNPNIGNPIASPSVSTVYYVTVTDANGCRNFDSAVVNTFPNPQVDAGPDTSICKNGANFHLSVQLQASGAVTYVWTPTTGLSNPNISNPVASPQANQTYYVTGTDTNGCSLTDSVTVYDLDPTLDLIVDNSKAICENDTTQLNVLRQGNSTYTWTPPTGISNPNSNSPDFYPNVTTTYIFSVQNYCYSKQDTATIIVHPLPPLTTQHVDSVCIGDTVQLLASGADTYQWQADPTLSSTTIPNPLAYPTVTDIYYVTGTETTFGCHKKDSVLVYVYPLPVPGIGPDTAYICLGRPVQLVATGGVDYQWRPDPSLSSATVGDPIATPTDTTSYYVTIYNIHQCHVDDSITINVQLPVQAVAESPYDVCEGKTIKLHASGGFYYQWFPATYLSLATDSAPVATPLTSIIYHVRVSNDCFSDTADVVVTIRPLPIVDAGTDTLIFRNTPAILSGTSNVSYIYWYPGQYIESPFELTTPATPLATTLYYLYAISDYGCVNRDSVLVTVDGHTVLLLPTAFSPNGDGVNDVFRIARYLNIESLQEFAVYDRWGEKVFSTEDITVGWNGNYHGHEAPLGVYIWSVKGRTYDGEDLVRSGNITLMR